MHKGIIHYKKFINNNSENVLNINVMTLIERKNISKFYYKLNFTINYMTF